MNHREFLASLTRVQRAQLTAKSDMPGLARLAVWLMLCGLCSAGLVSQTGFLLVPLLVIQGLLLVSLFHLLHEAVHDTPFASDWLNRLVEVVCGCVLFIPPLWFRYFHHAHHRFTQDLHKDPELQSPKPDNVWRWVWHVSGVKVWYSQVITLWAWLWREGNETYIPERHRLGVRHEVWLMWMFYCLCLAVSVLLPTTVFLKLWIVPLLLGQPFLRLYLLAEHAGCEHTSDMFANTRTVLTNPLLRWFTWNMPYHTEHHAYPTVPFHRLPQLHGLMQEQLHQKEPGYLAFNKRYWQSMSSTKPATDNS